MARIRIDNVHVNFPVQAGSARSLLRTGAASLVTGGRISAGRGDRIVVEALCGVSLSLNEGDRLGLIGPNGSGKSTLLRVCAGIYPPAIGSVRVEGRIVPMLDLTAGMDWEATGRSNIFHLGRCLGYTQTELKDFSDEIISFADLGHFLDLPVRTYSAGMLARLTFSIATSGAPDILLLDEVIGAGDADFLERARKRLSAIIDRSGILVLASHSESLQKTFCKTGAVIHRGKICFVGDIDEAHRWMARA